MWESDINASVSYNYLPWGNPDLAFMKKLKKKKKKIKQALNKSYLPCIPTAKHLFSTENSRTVMKVIGREFGLFIKMILSL